MLELMVDIFTYMPLFRVTTFGGIPIAIVLLVMVLKKSNRDERGLKIIGKASIISLVYFVLSTNFFCRVGVGLSNGNYILDWQLFMMQGIQFIFDTVLLVEIIAILILRRRE